MDPKFQTSFIPKKPILSGSAGGPVASSRPVSIVSVFTAVVLIVTVVLSGALLLYKNSLSGQIVADSANVASAREAFQPDTIKELISVSGRIISAEKLLDSHSVPSQIFAALGPLTMKKVRLSDFSYTNKDGVSTIAMTVEAQSYNALAQQANAFSKSSLFNNSGFSDVSVSNAGNISSKFTATVNPDSISYKKIIEGLSANQ